MHVPGFWRLVYSQRFLTDYIIGLLIALNFIAFRAVQEYFSATLQSAAKLIRFFAGYTFSLYLFHYPMIRFCSLFFPNRDNSLIFCLLNMLIIFVLCLLLGHITEKQRWIIKQFISWTVNTMRKSGARLRSSDLMR